MNATELARDKFNALFAVHDAQDKRAFAQQQKLASMTIQKTGTREIKTQ